MVNAWIDGEGYGPDFDRSLPVGHDTATSGAPPADDEPTTSGESTAQPQPEFSGPPSGEGQPEAPTFIVPTEVIEGNVDDLKACLAEAVDGDDYTVRRAALLAVEHARGNGPRKSALLALDG